MAARATRIVVADDHEIARRGVAVLLSATAGFDVVGEAADGSAAVDLVLERNADVAVLDVVMPVMDGIAATRRIREVHPRTEVVILTAHGGETVQRQAFEAGARGFVLKGSPLDQLTEAIRRASLGDYTAAGASGEDVASESVSLSSAPQPPGGIVTPRERQIACLLADGYSTKEAAAVLDISVRTAETHRASIMRKLGAKNVADVVKYCIRSGLIDL